MAIRTGFFDAAVDEATGVYDRTYDSQDFVEYFENMIGSGVCVYQNGDSMRVTLSPAGDQAIVAAGYLFIKGYWLKNDEAYPVELAALANGIYAVCARLNLSRRAIELVCVPKATPETYADALVLGYVTITAPGVATVEDTRSSAAICGLIDAAGSLCEKVEYALRYIDTEIEGRLEQIERDMRVQEAAIDGKIEQAAQLVGKMAPPPIGSIKYSAAAAAEQGWIPCDGSFINETDYPELVAAMGKCTPGSERFAELLQASATEQVSNCVVYENTVWVYLLRSKKLIGFSSTGVRKEITITGVESLVELPTVDTVLSICNGAMYLAQNSQSTNAFILLESTAFDENAESILMTGLPVSSKMTGVDSSFIYPEVTDISGRKHILLGVTTKKPSSTSGTTSWYLTVAKWTAGDFTAAALASYEFAIIKDTSSYSYVNEAITKRMFSAYLSMSHKNSGELFYPMGSVYAVDNNNPFFQVTFDPRSQIRKIYGAALEMGDNTLAKLTENGSKGRYFAKFVTNNFVPSLNIVAVAADNEYLYRAEIVGNQLQIEYGKYNPKTVLDWKLVGPKLPSRAKLFKDSVVYLSTQGLWFVFVGTGILFTNSLADGEWGYLDTQEKLGVITQFGSVEYDSTNNMVWIGGVSSNGLPKIGQMKLPNLYNYANNGAWLPMIAADGVPAYIKAKEPT